MTRPGMTLIEVLAATVLLTLMSVALVPVFRHAPELVSVQNETELTTAELGICVGDLITDGDLHRSMMDDAIAGQSTDIEWAYKGTLYRIYLSLIPHDSQTLHEPEHDLSSRGAPAHPLSDSYAWLRFECDGCAVLRVISLPEPDQQPHMAAGERPGANAKGTMDR